MNKITIRIVCIIALISAMMVMPAAAQLADTPWPMFQHDLQHTGQSPYIGAQEPTVDWTYFTDGYWVLSPVIDADGTIYIGSDDGNLYALNPDGTKKWNFVTGNYIESAPAIDADGTIYIGSSDNKLYALNPDGSKKWEFVTGGSISESAPAIDADGTIYFGSHDHKFYALNPDGSKKWEFVTGYHIYSSPAIDADGTIYFGSCDNKLYALNPDGSKKWEFLTGQSVTAAPAIGSDGTIYIGSYDNKLYALNPDGSKKWEFLTGDYIYQGAAIGADGTIYFGSSDNKLYALNPDGSKKWDFLTGDDVFCAPVIDADGTIYFQSDKFYAINSDGSQKWELINDGWYGASGGAIGADGTVYFQGGDGYLYAIGPGPTMTPLEFGDAPDPTYPSLLASNGARHNATETECLGLALTGTDWKDFEPDANIIDADPFDDGLVTSILATNNPAQTVDFEVTNLIPGDSSLIVNILLDLNGDGDWNDVVGAQSEHVVQNQAIPLPGIAEGTFTSDPFSTVGATEGATWMRITLTRHQINAGWDGTMASAGYTEPFECGETEDWLVELQVPPKATVFFDPGDIRADGFCDTETVGVWVDASEAIKGGAAVFDYTFCCANVTGYTPDPIWEFLCKADLSTPGTVSLGFGTMNTAGYGPGLLHIMDLDIHCCNGSGCCGTVLDWDTDPATSYVQNMSTVKIPVKWEDGTFLCGDAIDITKKVWDGSAWVDAIGPLDSDWLNQDVRFNITVTSGCLDLSGVTVDDVMDSNLQYNNNANPAESASTATTATWNLGSLAAYTSTSIEFNATIVDYGEGFNTANVTATVTDLGVEVSEEADASVTTMPPAGIDVNKTVWDGSAWVDEITGAMIGDTYRFRCEMENSGSPGMDLTNIIALDVLSDSLEYANNARIQTPSGVWRDINPPDINDPENNTVGWTINTFLQDPLTLQPGQMIVIEFNATVVDYGYDCNNQIAEAWCAEAGQPVSGNDTACIDTPEPDLNVTKITVNPDVPYFCDKAFGPTNHPGAKTQCNNISAEIIEGTGIDVVSPFDVTFEIDGVAVCTVNVPGLAGGATETVYCNCAWYPFADETDTITVTVDSAGAIPETDEGNNTLARDVTAHVNGWKGDSHQDGRNITTKQCHEQGTINLVYSVGNSSYLSEYYNPGWTDYTVDWTAGDLTIPPEDSCIKKARLYVYYAWDKSAAQDVTNYFDMEFNGYPVTQDGAYSDTKFPGQPDPCVCDCELLGYPAGADYYYHMCKYSYGYGMVAYDVADEFVISGNTAHLTNSYPAAASMQGMLLVVVYNNTETEPERIIWINEGFDILKSGFTKYTKNPTTYGPSGVTSEEATVYAPFEGCEPIPMAEVVDATLVTITNDAKDVASKDSNRLYFNGEYLASGAWTEPAPGSPGVAAIGHNVADVRTLLKATDNTAAFQSHDPGDLYGGDSMEACNAFLIVQKAKPEMSAEPESDECNPVGGQFDVLINITPRGAPIMGAQFDLHFNASVLQAETVTYGDFLVGEGSVFVSNSDIDNANGVVSFAAARQGTPIGVTEPGTFAIVHFTAMMQGETSELDLVNALASTNSTPIETIELVNINGEVEICSNSIPTAEAKSDFRINNIAEKGLSKAYFNGTESTDTPPGTITYWRWWVDDGSSLVGEIAEHLFEVPMYWDGNYVPANVTLTVTDDGIPLMDGSDTMEVTVWIAGDATGDGRVNIADAVTFGMQFGADCHINGDGLRWYDNLEGDKADLNNDKRVNIGDAMLLGTCWGHTAW